jgi:hypothetical protein
LGDRTTDHFFDTNGTKNALKLGESLFLDDRGGADRAEASSTAIGSGADAMSSLATKASGRSNSRSLVAPLTQY